MDHYSILGDSEEKADEEDDVDLEVLIKGLGASPGLASGTVKIILDLDELDKVQEGDVMVTTMTTPDMVSLKRIGFDFKDKFIFVPRIEGVSGTLIRCLSYSSY